MGWKSACRFWIRNSWPSCTASMATSSFPTPKRLLIDAAGPELPEEVWNRPKQGFTFPFEQWMKDSPITAPRDSHEAELYREFKRGQLGWGRYWCALLAGRFAPVPH